MRFRVTETDWHAKATRKRVRVEFFGRTGSYPGFWITLFVPRGAARDVPAFVGMHLFDTKLDDPIPGKLLDADAWAREQDHWLPSKADGDFIASLMQPVAEPGQFAAWIAPPKVGIDNRPGDFEYVKVAA